MSKINKQVKNKSDEAKRKTNANFISKFISLKTYWLNKYIIISGNR